MLLRTGSWLLIVAAVLAQSWKDYPLVLENNDILTFPNIEGPQYQYMGESWYLTAEATGQTTGKKYQVSTIFSRNYITAAILNFYQVSIAEYGSEEFYTYTSYDLPGISLIDMKFHAEPGGLNLGFDSPAGPASWTTVSPFNYSLNCPGVDHLSNEYFEFKINCDMQKMPVAYGASTLRGFLTFYSQPKTLSYFNPGAQVTGTLTFNGVTEEIKGTRGHIDRQIFPLYAGIASPTGRQKSHEWWEMNFDNGIDLAIWRQYDRRDNSVIETTGTTISPDTGDGETCCAEWHDGMNDIVVEHHSYSKFPRENFSTIFPPPSANMYMPSKHVIRNPKLGMELLATYTTPAPIVISPIEYFDGPVTLTGTFRGQQVTGIGAFDSTLALYRDWELSKVLLDSVTHIPVSSFGSMPREEVLARLNKLDGFVSSNPLKDNRIGARLYVNSQVLPALETLISNRDAMLEIANDFKSSLDLILQF